MTKRATSEWNPITSPKTSLVVRRPDGVSIFRSKAIHVAGSYIAVWDKHNWVACESLAEAWEATL